MTNQTALHFTNRSPSWLRHKHSNTSSLLYEYTILPHCTVWSNTRHALTLVILSEILMKTYASIGCSSQTSALNASFPVTDCFHISTAFFSVQDRRVLPPCLFEHSTSLLRIDHNLQQLVHALMYVMHDAIKVCFRPFSDIFWILCAHSAPIRHDPPGSLLTGARPAYANLQLSTPLLAFSLQYASVSPSISVSVPDASGPAIHVRCT
jgi:hypothetical protein